MSKSDSGIINKPFLEKDIELLDSLVDNEGKCFDKIMDVHDDFGSAYKSDNLDILSNKMDDISNIKKKIKSKREKYIEILNKVIVQYDTIAGNVVKKAKEEKNKYE